MPTKEIYEKYEAKQTLDKKRPEHLKELTAAPLPEMYSKKAPGHLSQAEINELAHHKAITCYDRLPDKDKDKPSVDSRAYTPNTNFVEMVGATQRPGDRKLGEQDD